MEVEAARPTDLTPETFRQSLQQATETIGAAGDSGMDAPVEEGSLGPGRRPPYRSRPPERPTVQQHQVRACALSVPTLVLSSKPYLFWRHSLKLISCLAGGTWCNAWMAGAAAIAAWRRARGASSTIVRARIRQPHQPRRSCHTAHHTGNHAFRAGATAHLRIATVASTNAWTVIGRLFRYHPLKFISYPSGG